MTEPIVIDIPASLATLLPTGPHVTDPVWFDLARISMFTLAAVGVAWLVGSLVIAAVRKLQEVGSKTPPQGRVKSQTFINWLVHGGVNGVQR